MFNKILSLIIIIFVISIISILFYFGIFSKTSSLKEKEYDLVIVSDSVSYVFMETTNYKVKVLNKPYYQTYVLLQGQYNKGDTLRIKAPKLSY